MNKSADPIPAPVHTLLDLFRDQLAAVRFPDVDGDKLTAAVRDTEEAALAVAAAEAALAAARVALDERQDALLARAQRALGYLRVFADGDAALAARLDAIVLPRRGRAPEVTAAATGEPRRRGRPPKFNASTPMLPSIATPEATTAAPGDASGSAPPSLRVLSVS
jgi:hypothetical protein